MMPDKDGIETLKEMKECTDTPNSKTPVVCLTANAVSGMREMYINAGFDDYLTKPIDTDRLESMLLMYLPPDLVEHLDDTIKEDIPEKRHSILIIANDVAFLKQVKEWLSDYNVVVVKSKEQAKAYLKGHEAQLILADFCMGELTGLDEEKVIRKPLKELNHDEILLLVKEFFARQL